jgi:hypothetical protein
MHALNWDRPEVRRRKFFHLHLTPAPAPSYTCTSTCTKKTSKSLNQNQELGTGGMCWNVIWVQVTGDGRRCECTGVGELVVRQSFY